MRPRQLALGCVFGCSGRDAAKGKGRREGKGKERKQATQLSRYPRIEREKGGEEGVHSAITH